MLQLVESGAKPGSPRGSWPPSRPIRPPRPEPSGGHRRGTACGEHLVKGHPAHLLLRFQFMVHPASMCHSVPASSLTQLGYSIAISSREEMRVGTAGDGGRGQGGSPMQSISCSRGKWLPREGTRVQLWSWFSEECLWEVAASPVCSGATEPLQRGAWGGNGPAPPAYPPCWQTYPRWVRSSASCRARPRPRRPPGLSAVPQPPGAP